ncbi:hypothetical protein NDU88_006363 [Pleurodeles waltl]|uniref:Uncharacterized protein n=1 Tax=Pleurodeles waltl TaxID=8319 RepID=A0AAV7TFD6_PLEWA|nr:hypothetical protein NDU88_006363 [Pleurodeles waltl]
MQPAPQGLRGTQRVTSLLQSLSPGLQCPGPAGSATRHADRSTGQLQKRSNNQASHHGPNSQGASTTYGPPPSCGPSNLLSGLRVQFLKYLGGSPPRSSPPRPLNSLPALRKGRAAQTLIRGPIGSCVRRIPSESAISKKEFLRCRNPPAVLLIQ